ncbi:hypothetical protein B0H19DRAFT_1147064 [Mycena capillaripes]|nr:hypothetical protein B0H19DRAFT_1147064 [Mycena capillaripes]
MPPNIGTLDLRATHAIAVDKQTCACDCAPCGRHVHCALALLPLQCQYTPRAECRSCRGATHMLKRVRNIATTRNIGQANKSASAHSPFPPLRFEGTRTDRIESNRARLSRPYVAYAIRVRSPFPLRAAADKYRIGCVHANEGRFNPHRGCVALASRWGLRGNYRRGIPAVVRGRVSCGCAFTQSRFASVDPLGLAMPRGATRKENSMCVRIVYSGLASENCSLALNLWQVRTRAYDVTTTASVARCCYRQPTNTTCMDTPGPQPQPFNCAFSGFPNFEACRRRPQFNLFLSIQWQDDKSCIHPTESNAPTYRIERAIHAPPNNFRNFANMSR